MTYAFKVKIARLTDKGEHAERDHPVVFAGSLAECLRKIADRPSMASASLVTVAVIGGVEE